MQFKWKPLAKVEPSPLRYFFCPQHWNNYILKVQQQHFFPESVSVTRRSSELTVSIFPMDSFIDRKLFLNAFLCFNLGFKMLNNINLNRKRRGSSKKSTLQLVEICPRKLQSGWLRNSKIENIAEATGLAKVKSGPDGTLNSLFVTCCYQFNTFFFFF